MLLHQKTELVLEFDNPTSDDFQTSKKGVCVFKKYKMRLGGGVPKISMIGGGGWKIWLKIPCSLCI